jgi:hypothetical protein
LLILLVIALVIPAWRGRYSGRNAIATAFGTLRLPGNIERVGSHWVESSDTSVERAWVYTYDVPPGLSAEVLAAHLTAALRHDRCRITAAGSHQSGQQQWFDAACQTKHLQVHAVIGYRLDAPEYALYAGFAAESPKPVGNGLFISAQALSWPKSGPKSAPTVAEAIRQPASTFAARSRHRSRIALPDAGRTSPRRIGG